MHAHSKRHPHTGQRSVGQAAAPAMNLMASSALGLLDETPTTGSPASSAAVSSSLSAEGEGGGDGGDGLLGRGECDEEASWLLPLDSLDGPGLMSWLPMRKPKYGTSTASAAGGSDTGSGVFGVTVVAIGWLTGTPKVGSIKW